MKKILIAIYSVIASLHVLSQTCITFNASNAPFLGNNVIGVYIDTDNSKWFATNQGALHYSASGWENYTTLNSGLVDNWLKEITRAGNGELFFASNNAGISRFDGVNWYNYTQANGLPSSTIYDLFTDSNGNVWIATTNGVAMFNGLTWEIKNTSNTSAFPSPTIKDIEEDNNNVLWMAAEPSGSWQGGASYFNSSSSCVNYTTLNSGIAENATQCLTKVNASDMWIGTWGGVSVLNTSNSTFQNYTTSNSTLPSDYISDIEVDLNNRVWVGVNLGADQGISYYDYGNATWAGPINISNSCMLSNSVNDIEVDQEGNVWIATTNGVTVFNLGGIINSTPFNDVQLVGSTITCEDDQAYLMIQADGGFGTYNFEIPGLGIYQNWNEADTIWYNPTVSSSYSVINITDALSDVPATNTSSHSITVNESYSIVENPEICNSDTYTLPNGTIVNTDGSYNSFLTSMNGCDSTIITNLTVFNPDVSIISNDTTLTSNASSATYQWIHCNNGNDPISGATSSSFTPTFDGTFGVIITENGCVDTSACILINVDISGLNEIEHESVIVYPNPADDVLYFHLDKSLIIPLEYKLVDLSGKKILSGIISASDPSKAKLDITLLPAGNYLILFKSYEFIKPIKIVKQ